MATTSFQQMTGAGFNRANQQWQNAFVGRRDTRALIHEAVQHRRQREEQKRAEENARTRQQQQMVMGAGVGLAGGLFAAPLAAAAIPALSGGAISAGTAAASTIGLGATQGALAAGFGGPGVSAGRTPYQMMGVAAQMADAVYMNEPLTGAQVAGGELFGMPSGGPGSQLHSASAYGSQVPPGSTFMPKTTENVKNAFKPIPGAMTIGFLAKMPMAMLLMALTNTVAVSTPLNGMPVLLMMAGLTTIMYMVARNVVIPATTSV